MKIGYEIRMFNIKRKPIGGKGCLYKVWLLKIYMVFSIF
jgi:hypothetical protein